MRLAHIAPTSVLKTEVFQNLDFHLCLASQALKDSYYAYYFFNAKGFVILDVPTWEEQSNGSSYDFTKLIQAIEDVNPNEVTLPDIWGGNAEDSIKIAVDAAVVLPKETLRGSLGFMAIPRGHTWDECVYCATEMSKIPGVTTLGILDGTYEKFNVHRLQVVMDFSERFSHLQLHLLGVQRGLTDIQDKNIRQRVRSADTAKLVRYGLDCKYPTYKNVPDYPGRGKGYFEREVNDLQLSYIAKNVRYWNSLLNGRN